MPPTSRVKIDRVQEAVDRLLNESTGEGERRDETRKPFFRPVGIITASRYFISAFSLDISLLGIRFVHSTPLQPGDVTVVIGSLSGDSVHLRTQIEWCQCQPWGKGWYLSGGRFLAVVASADDTVVHEFATP